MIVEGFMFYSCHFFIFLVFTARL